MNNNELKSYLHLFNLTEQDIDQICNQLVIVGSGSEIDYYIRAKQLAKEYKIDYNNFLFLVRNYKKSKIKYADKIKHYHRTSLNNFKSIIKTGALLSREELKKIGFDTSKFQGSTSKNVQLTYDLFDENGNLIKPGFDGRGVGNTNTEVIFVFGPELIEVDNYDCFRYDPTITYASIKDTCIAVLAKDEEILNEVSKTLEKHGMNYIQSMLIKNWDVAMVPTPINQQERPIAKLDEETSNLIKQAKQDIEFAKQHQSELIRNLSVSSDPSILNEINKCEEIIIKQSQLLFKIFNTPDRILLQKDTNLKDAITIYKTTKNQQGEKVIYGVKTPEELEQEKEKIMQKISTGFIAPFTGYSIEAARRSKKNINQLYDMCISDATSLALFEQKDKTR